MATKKQLVNRWLEEPGQSVAARIRQILLNCAETRIQAENKLFEETGKFGVATGSLPAFDTKTMFDMLEGLPLLHEVPNGRDLRAVPCIGGNAGWDFRETDFSFVPGASFHESNIDDTIFDGSRGEFDFCRVTVRRARFRKVHFKARPIAGTHFGGNFLECDFAGSIMKKANFMENADLRGTSFEGAILKNARLIRCDLRGCSFRNADLSGMWIQEAIIDKTTDFRNANVKDLLWQARRDNSGEIFLRASDWRQGTYDSTTIHD